jgi:hypothetical protein
VIIKSLKTTQKSDLESKSRIVTTQLAEYFSEIQNLYLTSLQTFIEKLEIPSQIMFIQNVATETQFCEFPNCFRNTNFIYKNEVLTLIAQHYKIHLEKQYLLTCSLQQNNLISIYHNLQFKIVNDSYISELYNLPPIPVNQLSTSFPDNTLRQLAEKDFITKHLLPLHRNNQIAFQCPKSTSLLVDGQSLVCDNSSLTWFTDPQSVYDVTNNESVIYHKTFKLKHIGWVLKSTLKRPSDISHLMINKNNITFLDKVGDFFKTDKIKFSTLSILILICVAFLFFCPLILCLWKPAACKRLLCCIRNDSCLGKLLARLSMRELLNITNSAIENEQRRQQGNENEMQEMVPLNNCNAYSIEDNPPNYNQISYCLNRNARCNCRIDPNNRICRPKIISEDQLDM